MSGVKVRVAGSEVWRVEVWGCRFTGVVGFWGVQEFKASGFKGFGDQGVQGLFGD